MKLHEEIDERLREFILSQPMFFVGTAPSDVDGHVNVSPKGLAGSLAVLGPRRVAYLDYGGSGAETIAHLRDNGRITLMFCAFEGRPSIVRLSGRGSAHLPPDPGFGPLLAAIGGSSDATPLPGLRTIIEVEVNRVSDSCGYSVPLMMYEQDRDLLPQFWSRKTPDQTVEYWTKRNATSIDGLPAVDPGSIPPPAG
jgi:pyridoxamine 5'-phosphate oxidase-like protein